LRDINLSPKKKYQSIEIYNVKSLFSFLVAASFNLGPDELRSAGGCEDEKV
jgi:hypothetical protein